MSAYEEIPVRGLFHRPSEIRDLVTSLPLPFTVHLEREADNRFDGNAVKVMYQGTSQNHPPYHIGYIGKEFAAWIAPEMDDNPDLTFIGECYDMRSTGSTVYPYINIEGRTPDAE